MNPLIRFTNGFIFVINFAAELLKLTNDLLIFFEYSDYAYVFFKAASNVLALYKPYDYKIELFEKGKKALRYLLLYKMSILELELIKAYFIDNLNKGFIEPLTALFAALVLFAKKQDGSFRFCIDFRALNNFTRKDRYFFLLIDKTFARLLRAKIFTKLDIRQAFYVVSLTRFTNGSIFAINLATELSELTDDLFILPEYFDYAHVFFKAASNVLALHKPYDHKIELLEGKEKALRYSLLYKMSILELELIKAYLIDNLNKGFIEPLTALFAALVLFVKKQDGSFRFCIDFRALNNLIRKDRYPFLLIDKTFARLLRIKIFTKLDIRQAFHRIRMDLALKELTTFKTRYGAYKCKVLLFGLTNRPATY
ncbi:polymerase [Drepanopeziza brunnea f. sp. 'multigermtubi' MB_m1]|uniref:Polymerase n=1 Tax=Marssonina brunnea f. sp. multigermtubi (strain MB_m1) TaxID=1072389 RepID=K1X4T9_MARBU|nr:polymerase [Drepanopeziza brunnea f. sp. 'multigermtubi' MB_m1]EKD20176.1 polymerase [Drepanopeziza brunnea f. sp. 'multigermtubi' MB_m1]